MNVLLIKISFREILYRRDHRIRMSAYIENFLITFFASRSLSLLIVTHPWPSSSRVKPDIRCRSSCVAHALPRALCCKWGFVDKGRRESLPSTRVPNRGLTRGRRRGAGRRIEIPRKKIFVPWNWTWDALIRPDRACIDVFNTHVTGGHSV